MSATDHIWMPFSALCSQLITEHCCNHMVLLILLPLADVVLFYKTLIMLKTFYEKLSLIQGERLEMRTLWILKQAKNTTKTIFCQVPCTLMAKYLFQSAQPYFPSIRNILFITLSIANSMHKFHWGQIAPSCSCNLTHARYNLQSCFVITVFLLLFRNQSIESLWTKSQYVFK